MRINRQPGSVDAPLYAVHIRDLGPAEPQAAPLGLRPDDRVQINCLVCDHTGLLTADFLKYVLRKSCWNRVAYSGWICCMPRCSSACWRHDLTLPRGWNCYMTNLPSTNSCICRRVSIIQTMKNSLSTLKIG